MNGKVKYAICKGCEKEKAIYCRGKCEYCYWQENKAKNDKIRESRGGGSEAKPNKVHRIYGKPRSKINNRSKQGKKVANQDAKFFREIFNERPHYSEVSGEWLSDTFNPVFCSHVLSKAAFPRARHWKENIMLKTYDEHQRYERADPTTAKYKREFKKVLERREELIIRYKNLKLWN